jgi:hypothetical protein
MRRSLVIVGLVLLVSSWANACRPNYDPLPDSPCDPADGQCLLDGLVLTENGQAVDFPRVKLNSLASDAATPPVSPNAPAITSATPTLTFANGGDPQSLDIAFTDPTGSTPAFFVTFVRAGGQQCFGQPCCWGCRATHRVFDRRQSGTVHYQVTRTTEIASTTTYDAIAYPVSCAEPNVDPVAALTGGPPCTYLTGPGIHFQPTFDAPPNAKPPPNGSSSSSGSSGAPGGCKTDADCTCTQCSATNGAICGQDGLCHCCFSVCQGSSCTCATLAPQFGCPNASANCAQQKDYACIGNRCATIKGLPKCG